VRRSDQRRKMSAMRAAVYARFSFDLHRATSIDDQVKVARTCAAARDYRVATCSEPSCRLTVQYKTAASRPPPLDLSTFPRRGNDMTRDTLCLSTTVGFAVLLFGISRASAQTIGTAQTFSIVGGTAVTASGSGSIIKGDVGIAPAAATFISGFPGFPPNQTGAVVTPPFSVRGNDAFAISAENAANNLYNSAPMAQLGGTVIGANLSTSGPTFNGHYTPGRYNMAVGTAIIPTSITLDGAGTYVFSLNSDLTTSVGSTVILNGVDPCTVWWRVPT
jgi:hypothetical protein